MEAASKSESLDPHWEALLEECRELAIDVAEQRNRAERLQALADEARAQAEAQEAALRDLAELVGIDPQLRLEQLDSRLGGQRLQEIAVQVLEDKHPQGEPIHYKQWYSLLRKAGYVIGGKDPQATFLASIRRSSQVRSVGRRSGLYVIVGGSAADRAATGAVAA
jgi:hypothetical protein